ncbi:hypothetical protein OFY17_04450 [Marinomonas sp. C2222]|uniref:Periplasmic binding protein domain-containing protein n=1 Tax=Marinomonas sargassi TaxID=2984494 RepID=A0ABT2YR53_9GAMM|nr:hypothetical protein [Marinomonas sargassi]MCV2402134.1 hypothetical protein [Marinomonas sargassi]
MRRIFFYFFGVIFSALCVPAYGEDFSLSVIDGEDFYNRYPSQAPLAEQFSAIISSPPVPIRIVQSEPVRIAVLLFGRLDSIENRAMLRTFRQRMREVGIEYRLDTYVVDDQDDKITPYFEVQKAQPDYLIVTKMGFLQRRFIEGFLPSSHTKVIVYGFASPLLHWLDSPPLMYIGFNQHQATKTLASFLERNLSEGEAISALVLSDSYLGRERCDLFLDEMRRYGRSINPIFVLRDDKSKALKLARDLLKTQKSGFVFGCSQALSEGVLEAIQEEGVSSTVTTNAWNLSFNSIDYLQTKKAMVNVLFMKDALSVAATEAIKLDLEDRNLPSLYMARFMVVTSDLDSDSLQLVIEEAYPYSVDLWQR